jgi:type IV secretion system protein VirB3
MRPQSPKPRLDSIVGGLTRPPMMLGIPFTLFVVEFCVVVLIFINTKNLLMFLLVIPVHEIAYALMVRDNRFVDVIVTRFSKCPITRNHRFWGGDSYKP